MRFSDSFLDEIRARLPVSEVVGRKVKLQKQGREWRGLSPFNQEKTPSFFVNDQKGFYYDFSAGKSGDIFSFVIETQGLSFSEAVEQLANQAGLAVPASSPADARKEIQRRTITDVLELASNYFRENLKSVVGEEARNYLRRRGISEAAQQEFCLGYSSPGRADLKNYLASKGVSQETMVDAGLLIAGPDIPVSYDRFRHRVMIPIHDGRGRVIGFGGRAVAEDAKPKYLNSPETSVFHKGSVVFNSHRARQPAHDDGTVIVVEGYMDAIAITQAGMKNVVATMGTAFGDAQIEGIWRLSREPILCFDGDRAGLAAAHRSIDRILPNLRVGRTFEFAFLTDGDPDELIAKKGIDAFKDILRGALPLWEVLWRRETEGTTRIDTPDSRAALESRLYELIKTIKDPIVNTAYYRTCRIELSELFWQRSRAHKRLPSDGLTRSEIKIEKEGQRHGIQRIVLGILVQHPELIEIHYDQIAKLPLDAKYHNFHRALYDLLVVYPDLNVDLIYDKLPKSFFEILNEVHGDGDNKSDRSERKPRGHMLFQRFPIMRANPPETFVIACLDHFVNMLQIEQLDSEIGEFFSDNHSQRDVSDESMLRIMEMAKELNDRRDRLAARDRELADEAAEIRRLGERYSAPLAKPREPESFRL
ncbi:MAG: DNA primase [Bauldia sp.]|nr:DNA primase [Bauldia sp.]